MSELEGLISKRTKVKSAITRQETAVGEFKQDANVLVLESRISDLTDLFKEFNELQSRIEDIQLEQADTEEKRIALDVQTNKDRTKIENQYYNTVANINSILIKHKTNAENPSSSNSNQSSTVINITRNGPDVSTTETNAILKPLPLPEFSGKYSEWFTFFDSFKSLVHEDDAISKIRKFHYLKGCLKDEALRAISALAVSSNNYDSAIELLQRRFENKRLIVYEHVANILNITPIQKSFHTELRELLDIINNNLASLEVLHLPVNQWDSLLIPIITEKLDFTTKKEWQTSLQKELPTFKSFIAFIEKRCEILETINSVKTKASEKNPTHLNSKSNHFKQNNHNYYKKSTNTQFSTTVISNKGCVFCKKAHSAFQCNEFLNLNVGDRLKKAEQLKLCINCLRNNHTTNQCKLSTSCKECNQRHHTLLHINEFIPSSSTLHISSNNQVLLTTVKLLIANKHGEFQSCRALLDQCSEVNLITADLSKKLCLNVEKTNTSISGVSLKSSPISGSVNVTIKSRLSDFATNFDCLILSQITRSTPSATIDKNSIEIPPNINLADPEFYKSQKIDLLIGAPLFWRLLISGPVQTNPSQPFLQQTKLGWIVGGAIHIQKQIENPSCNFISAIGNLENEVNQIWDQSDTELQSTWSKEHINCENHFSNNTLRAANGQFVVKLPFKINPNLGNSRNLALKQFLSLENRLKSNKQLRLSYTEFMEEYKNLGHMELVPENKLENPNSYYLPHHPVFKETDAGPKLRVVFNASAKTSNKISLNDTLMTGPTIQEDLFSILVRFRTYQFALSADITKMYRMVLVNPSDTEFQRILWRDNSNESLKTYRLNTVTYGMTSSAFLAVRCLHQLAIDSKLDYPIASNIIQRDFYMDDLLTGSNSIEEVILIKEQVSAILSSGGFNLCKWASNISDLLPSNGNESIPFNFNKDKDVKVLGFYWNCRDDDLKYKVEMPTITNSDKVTKRIILSTAAKIFDPLGLINPTIVKIKILLQEIWTLKLDWDEQVPVEIHKSWKKIIHGMQELNTFRVPRKLIPFDSYSRTEIHGFADASSKAYGAAVYLKTNTEFGNKSITLLCAKSRLAPLNSKTITLPRLELNAAVLMSNLVNKIIKILNIHVDRSYYWSDSTIVLSWLAESSGQWNPYVAHRVAQIHSVSSPTDWHHVRSGDNPADIVSRGSYPKQLKHSDLWWHGPEWLLENSNEWPTLSTSNSQTVVDNSFVLERKSLPLTNLTLIEPELPVFTKFSSFLKLQRVVAYILRFANNCKNKTKSKKSLTVEELDASRKVILRCIQSRTFVDEIKNINQSNNKLSKLNPFIDADGLLRVGGRLRNAPINFDNKFPILLPAKHHITTLIIKNFHEMSLHSGNEATLAAVRQQFWPLSARNSVRKIIHRCVKCSRANPMLLKQKMGDLPKSRLEPIRPFYRSGVDYSGPFLIKEGRTRRMRKVKAYVAVFICFATKAIHIELVGDLTTESFIGALKRFISRRGNVAELFSDNGSNFVGAEKELFRSQTFQNSVINDLSIKNTKFHFIPPRSPHFGGLWERAIKSVKLHLHRVVADASLTFEEFYTFLTCVEACLNSRPISPLSDDPNDLEPLTPGHFLIGAPLTAPIERDLRQISLNRLSRWQRIQQLQQHFWTRWHRDYLSQLQLRPKGQRNPQPNLTIGTLVVLVEENLPPLRWKLGRIIDTHPGSDSVVRVVTVKTANGIFKRAIKKVCVIPTDGIV